MWRLFEKRNEKSLLWKNFFKNWMPIHDKKENLQSQHGSIKNISKSRNKVIILQTNKTQILPVKFFDVKLILLWKIWKSKSKEGYFLNHELWGKWKIDGWEKCIWVLKCWEHVSGIEVVDDMLDSKQKAIDKFYTNGRHFCLEVLFLSQHPYDHPKTENSNDGHIFFSFRHKLQDVGKLRRQQWIWH